MVIKKIGLTCLIHGDYSKFEFENGNKQCPVCLLEQSKQKEAEEIAAMKYGAKKFEFKEIIINCDVHGEINLKLPTFVLRQAIECPKCVSMQRKDEMESSIQSFMQAQILESGIPQNTFNASFGKVDTSRSPRQAVMVQRLVKYIKDMVNQGNSVNAKNILFSGNMGTGKTLFASIVLQNIIKRSLVTDVEDGNDIQQKASLACLFLSEQQFQSAITATWGNNKSETTGQLIRRLAKKPVLCIDDVGAVSGNQAYLLDAYNELMDERYKNRYPTIFTSNLSYQDLSLAIGVRSADRFLQKDKIIVAAFDWNSYRMADKNSGEIEFL